MNERHSDDEGEANNSSSDFTIIVSSGFTRISLFSVLENKVPVPESTNKVIYPVYKAGLFSLFGDKFIFVSFAVTSC